MVAEVVMIHRRYSSSIIVDNPSDYFERWYADVWHRHFDRLAARDRLRQVLEQEMKLAGGKLEFENPYPMINVTFPDDRDYMMFVLRWS